MLILLKMGKLFLENPEVFLFEVKNHLKIMDLNQYLDRMNTKTIII